MSIRISLDSPPEFYTNLDIISGRIILNLSRQEFVSNVVVKLEGESRTALAIPINDPRVARSSSAAARGNIATENHKILYRLQQVYPDERAMMGPSAGAPTMLNPGQHEFRFSFKVPLNKRQIFSQGLKVPHAMLVLRPFASAWQ